MKSLMIKAFRDELGASAIEYAFIAALISLALIGGFKATGSAVLAHFETVSEAFPD